MKLYLTGSLITAFDMQYVKQKVIHLTRGHISDFENSIINVIDHKSVERQDRFLTSVENYIHLMCE